MSVNITSFVRFQMLINPGRDVPVGFTYMKGVTASPENLINYIGPYGTLRLVEKRDDNLNVLKTILLLVPSLQKFLVNFCHLLSVNL